MLAYTYPLLNIFWTMLWFFAFFVWIWLLIVIFGDIFRSHDMGGFAKALWIIGVIIFPLIGILIYLIARGGSMHERSAQAAESQKKAFDDYVRQTAASDPTIGGGGTADELSKLAALKDKGTISQEEFDAQKAKILS